MPCDKGCEKCNPPRLLQTLMLSPRQRDTAQAITSTVNAPEPKPDTCSLIPILTLALTKYKHNPITNPYPNPITNPGPNPYHTPNPTTVTLTPSLHYLSRAAAARDSAPAPSMSRSVACFSTTSWRRCWACCAFWRSSLRVRVRVKVGMTGREHESVTLTLTVAVILILTMSHPHPCPHPPNLNRHRVPRVSVRRRCLLSLLVGLGKG